MDSISKSLLILFSLLTTILGNSQPSITWNRTFDGPGHADDVAYDITESTEGYFYTAGWAMWGGGYILKLNPYTGDSLWSRVFYDRGSSAIVSSGDGGVVFTGGPHTVKLSSTGNIVWNISYGGGYRSIHDLIKTSDGGYLACGYDNSSGFYGYIFKTDSLGNLQWQRTYPAGYSKSFSSVVEIIGDGYVVVGQVDNSLQDTSRGYILKIDYSGEPVWEKWFRINKRSTGAYVISKLKNAYLVGGNSSSNQIVTPFFLRTDTGGQILYTKVFEDSVGQIFTDIKPINNNRYVVTILRDSLPRPPYFDGKTRVLITDSLGNVIRSKDFVGGFTWYSWLWYRASFPLDNGDILFAGEVDRSGSSFNDLIVTRTDSLLNAPPVGIKEIGNEIPTSFRLYQNFPNPFNSITVIKFDINEKGNTKLVIYDLLGREVYSVNEFKRAGSYEFTFDGTNFASGLYYYRLQSENFTETKKMVIIK